MFQDKDFIKVSDERPDPKVFKGILLGPDPDQGSDRQWVAVFVTDADNGFGYGVGCTVTPLKKLGDGFYGA